VLAERAYRAQEAQSATVRQPGDSGPGHSLGDLVEEGLRASGIDPADAEWDSRKRADGGWLVRLSFNSGSRPHLAEWIFDPHRKHVAPADDTAMRLCLPDAELPAPAPRAPARATVTPIGSRLGPAADADQGRPAERARVPAPSHARKAPEQEESAPAAPVPARERPARKAAGGRSRRSSVPSWDEIMFGNSRPTD
jgi:hypothetical protein